MNCTTSMNSLCLNQGQPITALQGLSCTGTPSNNLVTFAAQSVEGGHHDPERIWNQDSFEFVLLDN
ncbi:MAG: hypothetical protein WA609_15590 [Terriglobales bacterium]